MLNARGMCLSMKLVVVGTSIVCVDMELVVVIIILFSFFYFFVRDLCHGASYVSCFDDKVERP